MYRSYLVADHRCLLECRVAHNAPFAMLVFVILARSVFEMQETTCALDVELNVGGLPILST
jgi:hypothetical protein